MGESRLVFSVLVGSLTTSIVAFTFYLFLRELWRQLINALVDIQDDEDAESGWVTDDGADDDGSSGSSDDDDAPGGGAAAGAWARAPKRTVWDDAEAGWDDEPPAGAPVFAAEEENAGATLALPAPARRSSITGAAFEGGDEMPPPLPAGTFEALRSPSPMSSAATPPPPKWVERLASRGAAAEPAGLTGVEREITPPAQV